MESEIDSIDKKIEQLRIMILQRFQEKSLQIENQFLTEKQRLQESIADEKDVLLKELDDRLALVKQFPSVLEADYVAVKNIEADYSFTIEYSGSFKSRPSEIRLDKGKWKILILAKKVD